MAAVGYVAHRLSLARRLAIEGIRMRIATDLHDDIGASLSQIAILSEVTRREVERDDPLSGERLEKIASASRELVDAMSDVIWAISPNRDSFGDLVHRMRRFANDALTPRDVILLFTAPEDEQHVRVEADVRREVYCTLKEAVNNAAKYAGGTMVTVAVSLSHRRLGLKVVDNGRGFDIRATTDGNGLASLARRAERLGGTVKIESTPGTGTTIEMTVPLVRRPPYLIRWRPRWRRLE